jgi:hypothetical protein
MFTDNFLLVIPFRKSISLVEWCTNFETVGGNMGGAPIIRAIGRRVPITKRVAKSLGLTALSPQAELCEVFVDDLWLQQRLVPGWVVALRLLKQADRLVVSEVRVFPKEEPNSLTIGEWSGALLGKDAACPEGGLTTRLVRRVRLGDIQKSIGAILEEARKQEKRQRDSRSIDDLRDIVASKTGRRPDALTHGEGYSPFSGEGPFGGITSKSPTKAGARRGRKPVDDIEYIRVAAHYAKRVAARSRHPARDVAARFKLSTAKAGMMIYRARERGFLSRVDPAEGKANQQGVAGGTLMPLAQKLLSRHLTKSNERSGTRKKRRERRKPK